jgi:hypothetical protein
LISWESRILEGLRLAVSLGGELAIAEIVMQSATIIRPVFVEGGNSKQIGNINLIDELIGPADELRNKIEPVGVDGGHFIHIDRAGNAADEVIRMRIFAAEDRVDLDDLFLPGQGVDIVSHCDQIHLGRQLVGRMSPISVGKYAQAVGGKSLDLVLNTGKISRRIFVPLGERLGQI